LKDIVSSEFKKLVVPILELLISLCASVQSVSQFKEGKPDATFESCEQWWVMTTGQTKPQIQFLQHLVLSLNGMDNRL